MVVSPGESLALREGVGTAMADVYVQCREVEYRVAHMVLCCLYMRVCVVRSGEFVARIELRGREE